MPELPKLDKRPLSILFKLLQLLIVLVSITLFGYVIAYLHCRNTHFKVFSPPVQEIFMFAIPLCWLLPIYLITTVVSPCLLSRQSTYGHRPHWLSPKERYFSIMIPALVTLGLAAYVVQPAYTQMFDSEELWEDTFDKRQYCRQRYPQPYFALALSLLVLIETYTTYRLDIQLPPGQRQQPAPTTCGKFLCFHKCVSSITHKNLSAAPSLASTCCSTARLLRNLRIVASIAGAVVVGFVITLLSGSSEYALRSNKSYEIPAYTIVLLLWFQAVISIVRPTVTRPALDLHPVLRFVFTHFPALALLTWTIMNASDFQGACNYAECGAPTGYCVVNILFSFLMALEAIWTFIFDRRRYNTARKVQKDKQQSQSQGGEVELVDIDDGKFQESESYDGKIEA